MRTTLLLISALALSGCALTPAQLKAIGESKAGTTVCFHAKTMGFESTTVVTNAGASGQAMLQVTPNCATSNARAPS
jgi:hypothetical protein